jgi:hypothetical protein
VRRSSGFVSFGVLLLLCVVPRRPAASTCYLDAFTGSDPPLTVWAYAILSDVRVVKLQSENEWGPGLGSACGLPPLSPTSTRRELVCGTDDLHCDVRSGRGVAGIFHDYKRGVGPRALEFPGTSNRRLKIEAAID